jgi:hypothetical protein
MLHLTHWWINLIDSLTPVGRASLELGMGLILIGWTGFLLILRGRRRQWSRSEGPPKLAELLLYIFARAKDIDALAGDLEEYFERDRAEGMSLGRARRRYWGRTIRSIGPQMWQAVKRIGLFGLIANSLRH